MESKNVLCLSWCDADEVVNYGQILQAIAMMKLLRSITNGKINYISYRNRSIREHFDYYIYHLNFLNGHIQAYRKTLKLLQRVIKENNINFIQIMDKKNLKNISKDFEILICGSDQIWHPQNYDSNYFLGFGNDQQKKIAFAASLPKSHIEKKYLAKYKSMEQLLKKFDAISVREHSSVNFVKELSGRTDVVDVLDPTFLIESSFWEELVEPQNIELPYIFVYIPNSMNEYLVKIVKKIKKHLHIETVYILLTRGTNLFTEANTMKFVSIGQFLYLIQNATCVVTSSFHAVVFSAIFHTDFYAYDVPNEKRGEDCRLFDVLALMGLENRCINQNKYIFSERIDFQIVEDHLSKKRKESIEFLNRQLIGYEE